MEKLKKYLICGILAASLLSIGCAIRIPKVELVRPYTATLSDAVQVADMREDKQLGMQTVNQFGMEGIFLFQAEPSEVEVIRAYLASKLGNLTDKKVSVSLQILGLRADTGFFKNDLFCAVQSKVTVTGKQSKEKIIESFANKYQTPGGVAYLLAKEILDPCLKRHANMIADYVLEN